MASADVLGAAEAVAKSKPMTEAAFQARVTELAERHGWAWLHIPRSMVKGGWRTQAVGPLARGWPDLLLVRAGRAMALELKTDRGDVSDDQERVGALLAPAMPWYVMRPRDWDQLVSLLA